MPPTEIDIITTIASLQQKCGSSPSYGQLWGAAASGRIPARRVGRGWRIRIADLPLIAGHFGLTASALKSA
jgi:hypothetical protein